MEDTIERRGTSLLQAAVRYAEERGWDVAAGTWTDVVDGDLRCSCGEGACLSPGAHAVRGDWAASAVGGASAVRRLWEERPGAGILLPTGRSFDVVEVPEAAGFLALARLERVGVALGPVLLAPDRVMRFFVSPGAAGKVPSSLRVLGEGAYVVAPPTRVGVRGVVQWVRRPTAVNRWLPDAGELAGALVYAVGASR
ncbi:bifunctional DNA primase/polymerase [Streptomyces sp. NPDC048182]|uniref:bifunctional DNA primase/polymerase n=1 Tax=Streptomyces sp. NPDC048182 TaxID=3365507 RepID=UPI00372347AF